MIVLALIVTSVVLLTPPDEGPRVKGNRFTIQDILSRDFQPLRFNGTWVSGKSFKLVLYIILNSLKKFIIKVYQDLITKEDFFVCYLNRFLKKLLNI